VTSSPVTTLSDIRFQLLRSGHLIILKARVNEAGPFNFILDTGASLTIITPEVAKQAGIQSEGQKATAIAAKGQIAARVVRLKSLRIGGVNTRNLAAGVMNLTTLSEGINLMLGGVVGYNLLRRYRVTLDYRTRTLSLH
jgi:clan AA aspartic protease (TIGR02281 family)